MDRKASDGAAARTEGGEVIDRDEVDRAGEVLRRLSPPLPEKHTDCEQCGEKRRCTWLKTSHVPIYAWVCEECWDEWVAE
jgi:hypothetical protein